MKEVSDERMKLMNKGFHLNARRCCFQPFIVTMSSADLICCLFGFPIDMFLLLTPWAPSHLRLWVFSSVIISVCITLDVLMLVSRVSQQEFPCSLISHALLAVASFPHSCRDACRNLVNDPCSSHIFPHSLL